MMSLFKTFPPSSSTFPFTLMIAGTAHGMPAAPSPPAAATTPPAAAGAAAGGFGGLDDDLFR
jgi:hypothetical protein